ncbi:MAG: hypothetical protein ACTSVL_06445 [Promethearchaeota archaeon]
MEKIEPVASNKIFTDVLLPDPASKVKIAKSDSKISHLENQISENLGNLQFIQNKNNIASLNRTLNRRSQMESIAKLKSGSIALEKNTIDLQALLDETEFNKIKQAPWHIDISRTLESFRSRMYPNAEIKFRIGGRIIYSASQIVKIKSNLILKESHETQDQLLINEVDEEDLLCDDNYYGEEVDSMDSILNSFQSSSLLDENKFNQISSAQLKEYVQKRDLELMQSTNMDPFYSEDRLGQRFLSAPIRKVYKKIEFGDLGKSLIETFNYQLKRPSKKYRIEKKVNLKGIIPENVLKKAEEERALVELQIRKMLNKINKNFKGDEPVPFLNLILTPDPDGIVRTLLYLLQLVNRKKIEIWQMIEENEDSEGSPTILNSQNAGIDIYITPIIQNT